MPKNTSSEVLVTIVTSHFPLFRLASCNSLSPGKFLTKRGGLDEGRGGGQLLPKNSCRRVEGSKLSN